MKKRVVKKKRVRRSYSKIVRNPSKKRREYVKRVRSRSAQRARLALKKARLAIIKRSRPMIISAEVAKRFGISDRAVRAWVSAGAPHVRVRGLVLMRPRALEQWLLKRRYGVACN
jgi:hypothetical protein